MPLISESLVEVQGVTVTRPLPGTAPTEHSLQQHQVQHCCDSAWAELVPNLYKEKKQKRSCKALTNVVNFSLTVPLSLGLELIPTLGALLCCLQAGLCGFTVGCLWLWGVGGTGVQSSTHLLPQLLVSQPCACQAGAAPREQTEPPGSMFI